VWLFQPLPSEWKIHDDFRLNNPFLSWHRELGLTSDILTHAKTPRPQAKAWSLLPLDPLPRARQGKLGYLSR
jgi:hypothetical protein